MQTRLSFRDLFDLEQDKLDFYRPAAVTPAATQEGAEGPSGAETFVLAAPATGADLSTLPEPHGVVPVAPTATQGENASSPAPLPDHADIGQAMFAGATMPNGWILLAPVAFITFADDAFI